MSKKKKGLFAFLTGLAMGAAAVFLSNKENREKTKEVVEDTAKKAKKLKQEVEEDPEKVKQKVKKKIEQTVGKAKEEIVGSKSSDEKEGETKKS